VNLLEVDRISVSYGDIRVLKQISFEVREGEVVSIVGPNGAGKTTTLKTISGILHPHAGKILFKGKRVDGNPPNQSVRDGIVQVPEGRMIFPSMTVLENLELGSYLPEPKKRRRDNLQKIFAFFPRLEERKKQLAGILSGGEQQMLSLGRGLMATPKLLMLDEPSLGLAPLVVREIFETLDHLNIQGNTLLVFEQNVQLSLSLCDRGYVLENGEIALHGSGEELLRNERIRASYLGI
jgi:branched-chain amino acid transport system ATP-binding protein